MKSYSQFITETSRKAQRASKSGKTPKEGPRSKGDDKPKAVVTVGLPGSGKSTIAKHMASKGKTDQHELDKSRQALGKGPAYFGQDIVKHTYDGAKKSAEQGKSTVLSNTSIPRQHRKDAIDNLKDSGYENVKAVLTPGSTKAAMRRNRKRTGSKPGEGAVPQFVMNRMAQGMEGMSRGERKELRGNYKELHKSERFTKPAMKRSGAIKEEFKDLTPEKEERVRNRVGQLARDIQVSGARMKDLNKKPFGKYRPKVKAEKESILKSARKKHKHVKNASDALVRTSISREAGIVKKMYDLKKRMDEMTKPMKTYFEFMELVESSTGEKSGSRNSLGRHQDKQITSGPSRSRAGLDRQRKSASDKAAFRKAGMKSTQSGGNRQRFSSTNDKNQYSRTIVTSYPSQSAYAKDSMPEKERRGKTVPTKDRAVFLRRLKKQLKTTRTPRGVHAVDVLPRHEYKKNDPRELISRGKEYHRVVKEIPQEVKNTGGEPGDKIVGKAAEVMSGSKNMEKGKKSRQKLYSKSLGATKSDPITKVQVASVKEEVE